MSRFRSFCMAISCCRPLAHTKQKSPRICRLSLRMCRPSPTRLCATVSSKSATPAFSRTRRAKVAPEEPVKSRYTHDYRQLDDRHIGYESSAVIVEQYAYLGDNAGMLHCVDLNTMELVWAQDLLDDINSTPLFDWGKDGNGYLYIAPSLDYSGGGHRNMLPICKIDARTGEILWKHEIECITEDGVSGGALASPLMGRKGTDIENLLIYSIGRSPKAWDGQIVALDKETGEVVWQFETESYIWSSPLAVYNEDGKSFIFQSDQFGHCYLLEGATGRLLDDVKLETAVESSPVAFGDWIVQGTRYGVYLFDVD